MQREFEEEPTGNLLTAAVFALGWLAGLFIVELLPGMPDLTLPGKTAWYGARASGMVAYLLSAGSVVFGMAISLRLGGRLVSKAVVADAHRSLSLLSLFAIGAHTLFLLMDSYADFGAGDVLAPFATWYRPFWTGLGIIAAYLAVAVYASFYLRSVIGYRAWRTFHYASFGVFILGTAHGLFAGSDTGETWALALYAGCSLAVALLFVARLWPQDSARPKREVSTTA